MGRTQPLGREVSDQPALEGGPAGVRVGDDWPAVAAGLGEDIQQGGDVGGFDPVQGQDLGLGEADRLQPGEQVAAGDEEQVEGVASQLVADPPPGDVGGGQLVGGDPAALRGKSAQRWVNW